MHKIIQLLGYEVMIGLRVAITYTIACTIFTILPKIIPTYFARKKILNNSKATYRSVLFEIKNCLKTLVIFILGGSFLVALIHTHHTNVYTNPNYYGKFYLWVSPFIFLLCYDLYFYVTHRIMHTYKVLFRLVHKVHHLSLRIRPLTAESNSFLEALIQFSGAIFFLSTIPMYSKLIQPLYYSLIVLGVYVHSGYELVPNLPILRYFFSISTSHNLHHRTFNYNYGFVTTIWDTLFKTKYIARN
ncbi:MAG: sterol desaturase family protein [Burkholderiales bacterium]|nr:sterol desaturase family protein [Burkholderiales bacterium]